MFETSSGIVNVSILFDANFPSDIDKFSEQGVGIALVQAKASPKTKQRAEAKGIKLYDDLSPEKVKEVREKVKKGKTGGNNNA